jgi:hypothetical protein
VVVRPSDASVLEDDGVLASYTTPRVGPWPKVRMLDASSDVTETTAEATDLLGVRFRPGEAASVLGSSLSSEKTTNPSAADVAMRAVAAARAGLADPSALPPGDPVAATFIALTAVAKDAESHIGVQLGPDAARVAVYGTNNCSHVVDFPGPGPDQAD